MSDFFLGISVVTHELDTHFRNGVRHGIPFRGRDDGAENELLALRIEGDPVELLGTDPDVGSHMPAHEVVVQQVGAAILVGDGAQSRGLLGNGELDPSHAVRTGLRALLKGLVREDNLVLRVGRGRRRGDLPPPGTQNRRQEYREWMAHMHILLPTPETAGSSRIIP
jgi:hypothetical protein